MEFLSWNQTQGASGPQRSEGRHIDEKWENCTPIEMGKTSVCTLWLGNWKLDTALRLSKYCQTTHCRLWWVLAQTKWMSGTGLQLGVFTLCLIVSGLGSRLFLNGRIIFRRDILFYSNSECSHESDPCTDVVTLLASHWSTKTDVTISLAERGTGRQVNQHRRGSWGCVKIKVKTVKTLWGRFCFS